MALRDYLSRFFLVAGHDNDLNLALDDHSPKIRGSVWQRTLAGDISQGATGTFNKVGVDIVATNYTGHGR